MQIVTRLPQLEYSSPLSPSLLRIPMQLQLDSSASLHNILPMNAAFMQKKKQGLAAQIAEAKNRLAVLEGQYNLLLELEAGQNAARPTVGDLALKGMETLGEFTKKQLDDWVRQANSTADFSIKSLDRVLAVAIAKGHARLSQRNVGNKIPAVYQWIEKKQ